jgi:ABC-type nitrate/sulfonate/bicarbonate transport system substrate-binding protein
MMPTYLTKIHWLAGLVILCLFLSNAHLGYAQTTEPTTTQQLTAPNVATANVASAENVPTIYGPLRYGADFNLPMTEDNFTYFESGPLAVQAVLSGQANIGGDSIVTTLLLHEQGQDFKLFCPRTGKGGNVLIGRKGFTKVEHLLEATTRVGVDSPGGLGDAIMTAILYVKGINATPKTLPNVRILESSKLRQAAFFADEIDMTILNITAWQQVQQRKPDAVLVASLYDDVPLFIDGAYYAPTKWLNDNLEVATAFCASVVKAQRALAANYDLYVAAVKELMTTAPTDDILRENWEFIRDKDFWDLKAGLNPQAIQFMAEILVKSGTLKRLPKLDDVLDLRAYRGAIKLLSPYETPVTKTESSAAMSTAVGTP